jgi:hypothetical protein
MVECSGGRGGAARHGRARGRPQTAAGAAAAPPAAFALRNEWADEPSSPPPEGRGRSSQHGRLRVQGQGGQGLLADELRLPCEEETGLTVGRLERLKVRAGFSGRPCRKCSTARLREQYK